MTLHVLVLIVAILSLAFSLWVAKGASDSRRETARVVGRQVDTSDELRGKAHKALDAYLDAGGPYDFLIISRSDYERNHYGVTG